MFGIYSQLFSVVSLVLVSNISMVDFKEAVEKDELPTVQKYFECCFDPNQYIDGRQIGHYVIEEGSLETFKVFMDEMVTQGLAGDDRQLAHLVLRLYPENPSKATYVLQFMNNLGAKLDQDTLLTKSIKHYQPELAEYLINTGVNVNIRTKNGFLPIDLAIRFGYQGLAKLLVRKTNLSEAEEEKYSYMIRQLSF